MSAFLLNPLVVNVIVLALFMLVCKEVEGVPNPNAAFTPKGERGCISAPVIPDILGDELLRCCEGWMLLNGKCVREYQLARQRCKLVTCPEGMVCSPHMNNRCVCPRGRTGHSCEDECDSGYYGWGCRQRCDCPEWDICNKINGACDYNDGDEDSDHDIASTTVVHQASNKTAGFCGSGCGLRGAIGCVCNGDSNQCECPGYAIALVVVSVLTWVTVGGVFAGYYVKRSGYVEPFLERYRSRKSNYGEEGDDSGFNTDVDQAPVLIPWCDFPPPISQRNSGEYPLLTPLAVPDLVGLSSYVTRISRDSLPRSTSHSSEDEDGGEEDDDDDMHDYLNVTEMKADPDSEGEEYSQPYEHLDHLSRQGSVHSHYAVNPEECQDSAFMIRTWTETENMRYSENSYVNESVLKWKRRFATKRALLSRQNRSLAKTRNIAPLSSSCSDVPSLSSTSKQCLAIDSAHRKPTVKPKPEFIKLKMMMDIEKRKRGLSRTRAVKSHDSAPTHPDDSISLSDINSSREYELDDPKELSQSERTRTKRIRLLRAALLKKGLSVPGSVPHKDRDMLINSEPDNANMDHYEGDYDPIYENECVLKSARQSRLNSLHHETTGQ